MYKILKKNLEADRKKRQRVRMGVRIPDLVSIKF